MTNATPMEHSKLSPSGAHRWMRCAGSLLAESFVPNKSSSYANEGTVAHELAAMTLESDHKRCDAFLGRIIYLDKHGKVLDEAKDADDKFEITQDMCENVQEYVDTVMDYARGGKLLVENKVDYSDVTGIPESFGTSDAVVLNETSIQVHDLKYGRGVHVDAEDNEQLRIYALGVLELYDLFDEVEKITLGIHMPRKSGTNDHTYSRAELDEFGEEVREAAQKAFAIYNRVYVDKEDPREVLEENGVLEPGKKQCQWCNFKAQCPALGNNIVELVTANQTNAQKALKEEELNPGALRAHIEDATEELVSVDLDYIAMCLDHADLVDNWVKAVREIASEALKAGKDVKGFKLVQGRKGNRKWADKDEAEETLKSMRLKLAEMYNSVLISPTQAEKVLKDSKRRWARVQPLITRSDGALSVAPDNDPRQAVVIETAEDDEFQPIGDSDAADPAAPEGLSADDLV